jgi:homoserine O-succinyltransferase
MATQLDKITPAAARLHRVAPPPPREKRTTRKISGDGIVIALVNNMPDAALEHTERQFIQLLTAAAGNFPLRVNLYSLPGILRGPLGQQRLGRRYRPLEELWSTRVDGIVVTGAEPIAADLRDEPYWPQLVELLDWAEENAITLIASCLAAHAAVLHKDGLRRHPLDHKRFGIFEHVTRSDHALVKTIPGHFPLPHSRWNEIREDELLACGYTILTQSPDAGVDLFCRRTNALILCFQGHPEYDPDTLLKEFKRDIRRFLSEERDRYPDLPHGLFGEEALPLLARFHDHALANRRIELMESFPAQLAFSEQTQGWRATAVGLYRNWLRYMVATRPTPPSPWFEIGA